MVNTAVWHYSRRASSCQTGAEPMPDVLGIPCTSPDEASLNSHGTMAVGSSDSCPRQFEEITFLLEKMKLLAELLSREPIFFSTSGNVLLVTVGGREQLKTAKRGQRL